MDVLLIALILLISLAILIAIILCIIFAKNKKTQMIESLFNFDKYKDVENSRRGLFDKTKR